MPLRIARYSDLTSISLLLSKAFYDEQLNSHIFPHRKEYPEDYVGAWHERVLEKWWNISCIFVVAYGSTHDDPTTYNVENGTVGMQDSLKISKGTKPSVQEVSSSRAHEVIQGVSIWSTTQSPSSSSCVISWWDPRRLVPPILTSYHRLQHQLFHNRAARSPSHDDPDPLSKWNFERSIAPFVGKFFSEPPYRRNHWELCFLGVNPKFQRHGIGTELVRWGLEKAEQDDLPAVVVGAAGTESFYQKLGFEILVGYASKANVDEEGKNRTNPLLLRGLGGGAIMWTR